MNNHAQNWHHAPLFNIMLLKLIYVHNKSSVTVCILNSISMLHLNVYRVACLYFVLSLQIYIFGLKTTFHYCITYIQYYRCYLKTIFFTFHLYGTGHHNFMQVANCSKLYSYSILYVVTFNLDSHLEFKIQRLDTIIYVFW